MGRRSRHRRNQRERNRSRWYEYLRDLFTSGLLTEDDMYEGGINPTTGQLHDPLPAHYAQTAAQPATPPAVTDLTWSTPAEDRNVVSEPCATCKRCKHCGAHHGAATVEPVWFSPTAFAKVRGLMEHFDQHEWLAYLQADDDVFTELVVPPQIGRAATVEVDAGASEGIRIDGVIHSHVKMRAFHSGTDDANLVANHPVSVVVAIDNQGSLSFDAVRTIRLECGAIQRLTSVPVKVAWPQVTSWVEEVVGRVRLAVPFIKETTTTTGQTHTGFSYSYQGAYRPGWSSVVGLCKTVWCYRNMGHTGACSQLREEDLCTSTAHCVLSKEHTGPCDGSENRPAPGTEPAGRHWGPRRTHS